MFVSFSFRCVSSCVVAVVAMCVVWSLSVCFAIYLFFLVVSVDKGF